MKNKGFTLIEMLVVVAIIMIILAVSIPLYSQMFKGQALKQADAIIRVAVAQARQYASTYANKVTFVYFNNYTDGGVVQVYDDTNNNRTYDTDGSDKVIPGSTYPLPKFVNFSTAGKIYSNMWFGVNPEGYLFGFSEVTQSEFESGVAGNSPKGDIILESTSQPYKMYLDLDVPSGKVRKSELFAQ